VPKSLQNRLQRVLEHYIGKTTRNVRYVVIADLSFRVDFNHASVHISPVGVVIPAESLGYKRARQEIFVFLGRTVTDSTYTRGQLTCKFSCSSFFTCDLFYLRHQIGGSQAVGREEGVISLINKLAEISSTTWRKRC
jgi:hypothetical protein